MRPGEVYRYYFFVNVMLVMLSLKSTMDKIPNHLVFYVQIKFPYNEKGHSAIKVSLPSLELRTAG